jgi:DNA-binding NarL/FixJ family response regulator
LWEKIKMRLIRLLLVDDSDLFLENVSIFLRQYADIEITGTAHSADEAMAQADMLRPDVLLLDVSLKGFNSLQIVPRLRSEHPAMGIIILTQYDLEAYRWAALDSGADSFIPKKMLCSQLLPSIHRVALERPLSARKVTVSHEMQRAD